MPNVNDETIYQAGTLLVNIVRQALGLDSLASLGHGEMVSTAIQKHPIVITHQPQNMEVADDTRFTMFVIAEGNNLSYQWQYQDPGDSWRNLQYGTGSSVIKIANSSWNGRRVRVILTDDEGYTLISDTAMVTVI